MPVGTPGELIVRNSLPWTINSGYKNMPEATANAWRNGWFHTGDEFLLDEEGNFFFLDRMKDVIRRRGVNISSFEVEEEVRSHPAVKDVAAVAVKNPDMEESAGDEEVKVVVVLEDDAALEPAELVEYLTPRMPRHWLPRFVEFAPELPRTESFKVRKADLRDAGVTADTWDRDEGQARARAGGALTAAEVDPEPLDETHGRAAARGREVHDCDAVAFPLRADLSSLRRRGGADPAAPERDALDLDDAGLRAEGAVRRRPGRVRPLRRRVRRASRSACASKGC